MIVYTYLFEEQDELHHQTREAVDAGKHIAEGNQELRFCEGEEDQANGIEPPADLETEFPPLGVSEVAIEEQSHPGQGLRGDLFSPI